jgi:hypothetical protein
MLIGLHIIEGLHYSLH